MSFIADLVCDLFALETEVRGTLPAYCVAVRGAEM